MGSDPDVDVVIAVHDPARPIRRAVDSVLDHNGAAIRVTVVCHNTPQDGILSQLTGHADDPRLRIRELRDGIRSPAGPFNAGLDAATGRFTSVMGSDDELEPGAIDSWLAVADRDDASAVIPRLRHAGGPGVPTPPVRPGRRSGLDGVKDRLSYRSAPLGLIATDVFGSERFVPNLPSGEDVAYVTAVWFAGHRISFDRRGPAYLIHGDARDRVTTGPRPVSADVEFIRLLIDDPRFTRLSREQSIAMVTKLLRVQIFGIVANRPNPDEWSPADRRDLADVAGILLAIAPEARRILSRLDERLLSSIQDPDEPVRRLIELATDRRRFLRPRSIVTADLRWLLAREAPLRMMAASVVVRGFTRRHR